MIRRSKRQCLLNTTLLVIVKAKRNRAFMPSQILLQLIIAIQVAQVEKSLQLLSLKSLLPSLQRKMTRKRKRRAERAVRKMKENKTERLRKKK